MTKFTKHVPLLIAATSVLSMATFGTLCLSKSTVGNGPTATIATEPVSTELERIVLEQSDAWNRGDIDAFMTGYWNDPSLTFSSGGETHRGWQDTRDRYLKKYPNRSVMGKLTFSKLETESLSDSAAIMLGNWHLERDKPVGGNFTLVWRKIDGKWLIIHDHSSAKSE
jgi:ketosteroid isomerase-like protein